MNIVPTIPTESEDWRCLPLSGDGRCLIEASAGTGKTWTIAVLYLRLLLETGLSPRQIVVTTFTIAAAQELRERLRTRMTRAAMLAERDIANAGLGESISDAGDSWLHERWANSDSQASADLARLRLAQSEFEMAPVTTLHGLCRKILSDFPFASGSAFALGEQVAPEALDRELRDDLWRRIAQEPDDLDDGDRAWIRAGRPALDSALKRVLAPGVGVRRIGAEAIHEVMRPANAQAIADFIGDGKHFARSNSALKTQLEALADFIAKGDLFSTLPDRLREPLAGPFDKQFKPASLARASADPVLAFAAHALEVVRHAAAPARSAALIRYRAQLIAQREQRLRERDQLTFDALISRTHQALSSDAGANLAQNLFEAWPVALVDEFQDTDALQYAILDLVYRDRQRGLRGRLVMIGDPKQAIYRFRGGDIHTYLAAKRTATDVLRLTVNFRSSRELVSAFNEFYGLAGKQMSQLEPAQIHYEDMTAAGNADQAPLTVDAAACARPLAFHLCAEDNGGNADRRDAALVACARHIAATLQSTRLRIGEHVLQPGDIAVLLPTNDDIARLRVLLGERHVPCVGTGKQSVFQTDIARDLQVLLYGIEHAGDETAVRAALATRFFGPGLPVLSGLLDVPEAWPRHAQQFRAWRQQWRATGVQSVIQAVISDNARAFMAVVQAERALTDVRHLGELLQQASERLDGPESLLEWLSEQRASDAETSEEAADEQQLRIESDARRVRLLTLHASKGLQFPVVFLPLMWAQVGRDPKSPLVHDPASGGRLLDLGSDAFDLAVTEEKYDDQDERFRVLYVALTRAQSACHVYGLVDGLDRQGDPDRSALSAMIARQRDRIPAGRTVASCCPHVAWSESGWAWPETDFVPDSPPASGPRHPRAMPSTPAFESRYSYSTLAMKHRGLLDDEAAGDEPTDAIDADPNLLDHPDAWLEVMSDQPDHPDLVALASIKGTDFGNALHALFERRDLGRPMSGQHDLVKACVIDAGVQLGDLPIEVVVARLAARIHSMLEAQLLPAVSPMLRLCGVPPAHQRAEMEFHFVLGEVSMQRLRSICAAHGEPDLVPSGHEQILRGLMSGKIDLIFEHEGRFHVLDYKSNFLGERLTDYAPEALRAAMDRRDYRFQALLYTVALDRYLRQRLPDFRRERDLGETLYLFVRAVGLAPGLGVWAHRFDDALIDAVDLVLSTPAGKVAA